ncbi:MAG: hypothetical protein EAZ92_02620 [Candidatus Kapaibacterium sp.]|nr:MAG: hypothetical protein EAZ92_02620 [Candidatus Kapabacteria bacterium]
MSIFQSSHLPSINGQNTPQTPVPSGSMSSAAFAGGTAIPSLGTGAQPLYVRALTGTHALKWGLTANAPTTTAPVLGAGANIIGVSFDHAGTWAGFDLPAGTNPTALVGAPTDVGALDSRGSAQRALDAWAAVANISFQAEATFDDAEIQFRTETATGAGGIARFFNSANGSLQKAQVVVDITSGSGSGGDFRDGYYGHFTMLHEIGHALGLKHPGGYGAGDRAPFLPRADDTQEFSVMSYNAGQFGGTIGQIDGYARTPMIYDIAAMQTLYGANTTTNAGNTTYTIAGGDGEFARWDASGAADALTTAETSNVTLDLREGINFVTRVGASRSWNAFGSNIENATSSTGNDILIGNSLNNILNSGAGNDSLTGDLGNDSLDAGAGNDTLLGGAGNDTLLGGADIDSITSGLGNDSITAGAGNDIVLINSIGDGNDTITDSDAGDVLRLDNIILSGTARFVGGEATATTSALYTLVAGTSTYELRLHGAGPNHLIITRPGVTNATSVRIDAFVTGDFGITLGAAPAGIIGTTGNDTLNGTLNSDSIDGDAGDDVIDGRGGSDTIIGGAGNNRITCSGPTCRVTAGAGNDIISVTGHGSTVNAGDGNNRVTSNSSGTLASSITAGTGNDTITATGGQQTVDAGAGDNNIIFSANGAVTTTGGNDTINVNGATVTVDAGAGTNLITFSAGTTTVVSSLTTGAGVDTLNITGTHLSANAGDGNDIINITSTLAVANHIATIAGGVGDDSINASLSTRGVILNGDAGNDTFLGGRGNDAITAGAAADTGNHSITGGVGQDTITLATVVGGVDVINYIATTDFAAAPATSSALVTGHDVVTNFIAADDWIVLSSALWNMWDDVGVANGTLVADNAGAVDFGVSEAWRVSGVAGITAAMVNNVIATSSPTLGALAAQLTTIGVTASTGADGLILVRADGGTPSALFAYTERAGANAISANELQLIAHFNNQEFDFADLGGNKVLTNTTSSLTLNLGFGNDSMTNSGLSCTINGGSGNDTVVSTSAGTLNGDAGNDLLQNGSAFAATLAGGVGNDTLLGGSAADSLTGGDDADRIIGGRGADIIVLTETAPSADVVVYQSLLDGSASSTVTGGITGHDVITDYADANDAFFFDSAIRTLWNDRSNDATLNFATAAANFNTTHEAMLVTAGGVADADLTATNLATVVARINAVGVTAARGEDALIVFQGATATTGIYSYVENGLQLNNVSASELTLLATVNGTLGATEFTI